MRRTHYIERRSGGPWAAIGWMIVGGFLAVAILIFLSFCGLAVLAGSGL